MKIEEKFFVIAHSIALIASCIPKKNMPQSDQLPASVPTTPSSETPINRTSNINSGNLPPNFQAICPKIPVGKVIDLVNWSKILSYDNTCEKRAYLRLGFVNFNPNQACNIETGNLTSRKGKVVTYVNSCHKEALLKAGYQVTGGEPVVCKPESGVVRNLITWSQKTERRFTNSCEKSSLLKSGFVEYDSTWCEEISVPVRAFKDSGESTSILLRDTCHREAILAAGYLEWPPLFSAGGDYSQGQYRFRTIRNGTKEWGTYQWSDTQGVPRKVCGKSANTIEAKINQCAAIHSERPQWDDVRLPDRMSWIELAACSAEDDCGAQPLERQGWTLVSIFSERLNDGSTCDSSCFEVWRDNETGLIWSDTVGKDQWCAGAGSSCANGRNNIQVKKSLCEELPGFLTPSSTKSAKAGINSRTQPKVQWKLPTMEEWYIAIQNGALNVLPFTPNLSGRFWTSTVNARTPTAALSVDVTKGFVIARPSEGQIDRRVLVGDGNIVPSPKTSSLAVRCVGQ